MCEKSGLGELSEFSDPCVGRGVPGVVVRLDGDGIGPYCTNDSGQLVARDASTSGGGTGTLCSHVEVPPGEYRLRLEPEDRQRRLACTLDDGSGWLSGWSAPEPNVFRTPVRAGFAMGTTGWCTLD